MTREQLLLTENVLIDAVRAFHDLDDKEKRETYVKDDTMFNFEHYKGKRTLEKIILSDKLSPEKIQLIELELINAIKAFHEIQDPDERAESIRKYTLEFCENNDVKPKQVMPIVKKFFAERAKSDSMFKYEHYKGGKALEGIILSDNDDAR